MNIKPQVDHIIVGQGLAGSCLALHLIENGKKILVFDEPEINRASAVAAGLFNPIAGKQMAKSWKADVIFPFLFQFYENAEKLLGKRFFFPQPIYRPFISIEEQNEWVGRSADAEVKDFIKEVFTSSVFSSIGHDPFGGILTKLSGYLDVNLLIKSVSELLKDSDSYQKKSFDPSGLKISPDKVLYEDIQARNIIFCEGFRSIANPFFNWVPIRPLKGETLSISMSEKPDVIFNRGVYLVPAREENSYIVGATYKPGDSSEGVTLSARSELEEKITRMIKLPFQIDHQDWGIRPTTPDRRPVIGPHPVFKNVVIFNGLGTKGVSLAPYFSSVLTNWLEGKTEIYKEVNIERFNALYSRPSSV